MRSLHSCSAELRMHSNKTNRPVTPLGTSASDVISKYYSTSYKYFHMALSTNSEIIRCNWIKFAYIYLRCLRDRVTEQNVTSVDWVRTQRNYLVVDFTLERLEGNHLRVLDDLLDVYGFNITYEVSRMARHHPCSVSNCSMSGHCFVSQDYR